MNILKSKIGIGTVQFGTDYGISNNQGKTSLEEVGKIIEYSQRSGIHYLDTASVYGDAESVLGHFDLTSHRIVSKYIPNKITLPEQFQTSLLRLGINSFYGYLAHRPLDLIENNNNWKILSKLKKEGKVKKIGASFNSTEELEMILDKGLELDIIQVPLNYFDTRFETYIKDLNKKGVEIHTRSTFLQGLFFCNPDDLDFFFKDIKPQLKELQQQTDLAAKLLKYVLEKPYVDVVNIGVNNLIQLKENLADLQKETDRLPIINHQIENKILMPSEWPKE